MLMCSPSSLLLKIYLIYVIVLVDLLYESDSSSLLLTAERNERSRLNSKRYLFPRRNISRIIQPSTSISHNSLVTIQ